MCGIVGCVGINDAYNVLIKGLKRLEYRGYDSAGVALLNPQSELNMYKTKGKVADLEEFIADKDTNGVIGIAHTRWATHGEPSGRNAHPHYSSTETIALVHNGIIENYRELKHDLISKGYEFRSDTDTEVLVQLIEYTKKKYSVDLYRAVQIALKSVIGAYAIAVLDKEQPDRIVAARKSSPLVIGLGAEGTYYLASDASPIVEYTKTVIYPDPEVVIELVAGKPIRFESLNQENVEQPAQEITLDVGMIEKGGFPHFMLKEIFDQPNSLNDCMRGRVSAESKRVILSAVLDHKHELLSAKRYVIVACGTSWHAGLYGKQLLETMVKVPVEVEYASEFRYRDPIVGPGDVVIAISQSGETADTIAAVELAKSKGAFIYGICNSVGSTIARATDTGTYIHVGPEIGVASTKAFTGQLMVLTLMALAIAKEKKTISTDEYTAIVEDLIKIPEYIKAILEQAESIDKMAKVFTYARNFIYVGRGYNYPVALEGALKLKEISYIHAEGYPAAEMKHGPIALIDEEMPVVSIATKSHIYEKVLSNIQEIKARNGRVLAIVTEGDTDIAKITDFQISVPKISLCLEPLLTVIPLQLLSYYIATSKGKDVDQPRNLAKSVTVE